MSFRRVSVLYGVLITAFMIVVCRIYFIACNESYAARVQNQSSTELKLPARRGNFTDCDGAPLTGLEWEWSVLCLPGENNYSRLYQAADAAQQALLYSRRSSAAPFLLRVRQELRGAGFFTVPTRSRSMELPLCRHLIGYTDAEGRGVSGLEAALDPLLAGSEPRDSIRCVVNGQGRLLEGTQPLLIRQEDDTVDIRLSISRPVQRGVEAVAAQMMGRGCILVLDTASARVRACVSMPDYDPQNIAGSIAAGEGALLNRALCAYAVGSVFKPVLAAAALEDRQAAALVYECRGYTVVNGHVYRCAGGAAHGEVMLDTALEKSCNGYFIALGQLLGAECVREMAERLGFGQQIALADGLRAAAGSLPSLQALAEAGPYANFCFGQGTLMAAPLQIAAMMNAIASGGIYRTPVVVEGTVDEASGELLEPLSYPVRRRVMRPETAELLRELLCGVVTSGTGREAAPVSGTAGGKTGTAQTGRIDPETGAEWKNLWFAGFWSPDGSGENGTPRYTIVVMQDDQSAAAFSSAAIFAKVCEVLHLLSLR